MVLLALLIFALGAKAQIANKEVWIEEMSTVLPVAFCQSGSFYRQCFSVTAARCEEVAMSAARICLSKHKNEIPDSLRQPRDGEHWGNIVGNCTGTAYALTLSKEFSTADRCTNINSWKQ